MSDTEIFDLSAIYRIALSEIENGDIQKINPEFYIALSQFIGKLKSEEYSGVEAKIKNEIVEKTLSLIHI